METEISWVDTFRIPIFFSLSSIAMILLNKSSAVLFPHVTILLILQNAVSVLILIMTAANLKPLNWASAVRWLPCAILFCLNLFSSLQSLVYISVPTFTVLRNTQPLLSVCVDLVVRGETTKRESLFYLFQVLLGAVLYCSHDLEFVSLGYFWAMLHIVSMTCYSVLVKVKCNDMDLSAQDMSYYNNMLSIPGLIVLSGFEVLSHTKETGNIVRDAWICMGKTGCLFAVPLSCVGGYFVSVSGFQAQQVMSPTSWLCLNNFSKIPAILISFFLFGGYFSGATVHGMCISIFCAYGYSIASRQGHQDTLRMNIISICLTLSGCIWIEFELIKCIHPAGCTLSSMVSARHEVPKFRPPESWFAKPNCSLWGVTTTIFDPSPAIFQFLAQDEANCIVVVGDRKTNHTSWRELVSRHRGRGFYLSPDDQVRLPLATIKHLPWNHFGRKNIGYLFVCRHKGNMIYDFDDDNTLRQHNSMFRHIVERKLGSIPVIERKHHLFNPYPGFRPVDEDFQEQFLWPRGFPLNFIQDAMTTSAASQTTVDERSVAVFQSLANNDPDVDAIFRMTRKLPITFQVEDKICALPAGTYSPWNSQAVLVRDIAFWGLLLPVTVTGRVSDIWRSYVTTRLLFETSYVIAFTSPFVDQFRNPHDYQIDLVDEHDLYVKTNQLLKILSEFSVEETESIHEAFVAIMVSLQKENIVGTEDVHLARAWVVDLQKLNVSFPSISKKFAAFTPAKGPTFDFRRFTLMLDNEKKPKTFSANSSLTSVANTKQETEQNRPRVGSLERTAVCVSGQIRSLNLKPGSPTWPGPNNRLPSRWDFAGIKADGTVAESIQKHLFGALGEFDVFMSVSTHEGPREPKVGDNSACEPLRPRNPKSLLLCEVVKERERKVYAEHIWKNFYYGEKRLQQGLLQQLYGMYRCSTMIRKHMISSGIKYDYVVRLRPDTWFHLPMPNIESIVATKNVIRYADFMYYRGGNQDWFGLGHAEAMFPYLERYLALQEIGEDMQYLRRRRWTAESFLTQYMQGYFNVTLVPDKRIAAGIVKPTTRGAPSTP